MKISELIKQLEDLHPNTEVAIHCEHGKCVPVHAVDLRGVFSDLDKHGNLYYKPAFGVNPETVAVLK